MPRKPVPGETDLATTHPRLAGELWDSAVARAVSAGSHKRVQWRCDRHPAFPFVQRVYERVKGHSCGVCRGIQIAVGYNDLASARPDLAGDLWDSDDGVRYTVGSNRKVLWRCSEHPGVPFELAVCHRVRGVGCGICRNLRIVPGLNDLATTHPKVAADLWDPSDGARYSAGSDKRVLWRCLRHPDYPYSATVTARVAMGRGCGVCEGRQVAVGHNDLRTLHPEVAATLVRPSEATTVTVGSGKVLEWVCQAHPQHPFRQNVKDRLKNGCPVCAGKQIAVGYNDLATTHPELAVELADPDNGFRLTRGSGRRVEWICERGHHYPAAATTRIVMDSGCPFCSNRRVLLGYNDLATTHPELAAELEDPSDALRITRGSGKKVVWLCPRGHGPYTNSANLRTSQNQGCPVCGKEAIVSRAESALAEELERRGHNVDRQLGVAGFAIDVALVDHLLAVEFDGAYWHHQTEERDRRKNEALESEGWTVMRFRERTKQHPLRKIRSWDRFADPPRTPARLEVFARTSADQVERLLGRLSGGRNGA